MSAEEKQQRARLLARQHLIAAVGWLEEALVCYTLSGPEKNSLKIAELSGDIEIIEEIISLSYWSIGKE